MQPNILVTPYKSGLWAGQTTELAVLLQFRNPPNPAIAAINAFNVGLVLDRSGSMARAMPIVREGATRMVRMLAKTDYVAVVTFDDEVSVLVPATDLSCIDNIVKLIATLKTGGRTNLFGGWSKGKDEVDKHKDGKRINRIILLSDGAANSGVIEQEPIIEAVKAARTLGIQTSVLGMGAEFNEILLESMARNGDGNYYYAKTAEDLPAVLTQEMTGMSQLMGRNVTLTIDSLVGVTVRDVFNDLTRVNDTLELGNLLYGQTLDVAVQLAIPALTAAGPQARFVLRWDDSSGQRQETQAVLCLPLLTAEELDLMPIAADVVSKTSVYRVAKLTKIAAASAEAGDLARAAEEIADCSNLLRTCNQSDALVKQAWASVHSMQHELTHDTRAFTKTGRATSYRVGHTMADPTSK